METETNAETYQSHDVGQRRWCGECARRTTVEDVFEDSTWDTRGEVAVIVTALDCGHALHREGNVVLGYLSRTTSTAVASATDPWA